jgi:hypothetical protein
MREIAAHRFFHAVEKCFPPRGKIRPFFPHNGKSFRDFSTQWEKVFHSVENVSRAAA